MGYIIQQSAHSPDLDELRQYCQEPLSNLAVEGLELFNRGEYFLAHEKLEEAWNEDQSPARNLYRAVIQVAVAYLQIQRRNYNGAYKMFLRLRRWIEPLPEVCRGVDVGRLRKDANQVFKHLVEGGRKQIDQFDQTLFKPVVFRMGS